MCMPKILSHFVCAVFSSKLSATKFKIVWTPIQAVQITVMSMKKTFMGVFFILMNVQTKLMSMFFILLRVIFTLMMVFVTLGMDPWEEGGSPSPRQQENKKGKQL
jgi:hypothetical protein